MPKPIPLDPKTVEAACTLHATLEPWRRTDEALAILKKKVPGFSHAETLMKVAAVNTLYHTNVKAFVRVADHFANELARPDLRSATSSLVERLAAVPKGGGESRAKRRTSLAAKFAHFFIDEERFPIYDKYAVRIVAKHAGVSISSLNGDYVAFVDAFDKVAADSGITKKRRRLDRYLWIQGQYEAWKRGDKATSRDLIPAFKRDDWPP